MLLLVGPLLLGAVIVLVAAWVTTGSRVRRAFGVAIGLATMIPVWLVPREHTAIRALWVLVAFAGALRAIDLVRGSWPLRERLIHVLSIVDTRRLRAARPSFDGRGFFQGVAWIAIAWLTLLQVAAFAPPVRTSDWLARWALALVSAYAGSAGAYGLVSVGYRAAGLITPKLHISPALARSVQEFWGERWNRIVGVWLAETFFRPLARKRHPLLGACLAFLASALIHAYIAWVAVGGAMALLMIVYFLSQAAIILMERPLRVRAWPAWAGHAWTVAWMVTLSPLFTEAAARVFGY